MGFRMRKSFKVVPGVRLNVSKTGLGASVGGKGGRYSVHSSGRQTVSAGSGVIPGVYYQQSVGGGRSGRGQAPAQVPAKIPKPGLSRRRARRSSTTRSGRRALGDPSRGRLIPTSASPRTASPASCSSTTIRPRPSRSSHLCSIRAALPRSTPSSSSTSRRPGWSFR